MIWGPVPQLRERVPPGLGDHEHPGGAGVPDTLAPDVTPRLIAPIKTLRTWTFVFTFLCICLTTCVRELAKFGMPRFWTLTLGVLVNVPVGFFLSAVVFRGFWMAVE